MTVAENGTIKSRTVKEEYKEEPKEELKKESKEDLKEESKEVKEELSANPIKHNPANENSKQSMLGNKGFPNTILNRIYEKLN